ncbi:cytochrome P450 4C1-like [Oppia nitens]|uniref:cytochrome P450 4C1-like n=1 Tax=Oppia nitens TaxID=1686743 RepID=UPI0023DAEDD8|nr:cytochrome P450 4C1-like [Oppia nitens]
MLAICLLIISVIYFYYKHKNRYRDSCLATIPGPRPRYPLIGNLDLFSIPGVPYNKSIYPTLISLCKQYNNYGIYKLLIGHKPVVVIFKSDLMTKIFSSNINIDKSYIFNFLTDWLGDSLVMTTGSKWKGRRKLLTPAFHMKILDDYQPLINEQTSIFVKKIIDISIDRQQYIDIREPLTLLTLDIICETAMGVQIGAQLGKNKTYVQTIHDIGEIFMKRIFSPWIWSDVLFYRTTIGRKFRKTLETSHSFTRNVINEKKNMFITNNNNNKSDNKKQISNDNNDNYFLTNNKKSMAFMDLLLDYHIKDNKLSVDDIREEVDTVMFAGHDTTSVSLGWTIYLIGLHPKVQEKIHEELTTIFGSDNDNNDNDINRDITSADIQRMTYLDCVLKESLRMYPSAPLIARRLVEDCPVGDNNDNNNNYVIPAGVDVFLMVRQMHYNREVFADPNQFRPERFQSDSSMSQINAYNYVPFSAGPRNCIGKRFAIIVEMIVLAKILLNFSIESLEPLDSIETSVELMFRAKSPLNVRFIPKISN